MTAAVVVAIAVRVTAAVRVVTAVCVTTAVGVWSCCPPDPPASAVCAPRASDREIDPTQMMAMRVSATSDGRSRIEVHRSLSKMLASAKVVVWTVRGALSSRDRGKRTGCRGRKQRREAWIRSRKSHSLTREFPLSAVRVTITVRCVVMTR